MFFAKGLLVKLTSADVRARVSQALRLVPDVHGARGGGAHDPVALLTSADVPARASSEMAVIRVWTGGRVPGGENPFLDPSVRHVVSAAPKVDPAQLTATIEHLIHGTPIGLAELIPQPRVARGYRIEQPGHRVANAVVDWALLVADSLGFEVVCEIVILQGFSLTPRTAPGWPVG